MPAESQPPLSGEPPGHLQLDREELPNWKGLLFAGLAPSVVMGVSLALALPLTPLAFVEPFVGNLIVGLIVGQVATRLPFLYATGVAAGGWILGAFAVPLLHYWLDSFANPQRVDYTHGFEMYIGICVTFGLVVSPLAGLVAAKTA